MFPKTWAAKSPNVRARQARARTILDDRIPAADELLTAREISTDGGPAVKTLANWRALKKGPPFVRQGRFVRYVRADYLRWISEHRIPTRG